ncbi:unnamed protein product [Ceutorhynchus assimilis]|uniref:Cytochrome P450 n=1 Tax=Ceutorhynchus assimilis TaxID=467358 RepID=A0A9N9QRI3_9CUCU|nr:unnamed protein product [Ceutorhynchus assimilis]
MLRQIPNSLKTVPEDFARLHLYLHKKCVHYLTRQYSRLPHTHIKNEKFSRRPSNTSTQGTVLYVLIAVLVVLITRLVIRRIVFERKLRWVKAVPAVPFIGNAWEFADSTKSLSAMQKYALKYNGLYFVELLFRPIIIITDYKLVEWLLLGNTILNKSSDYQFLYNWLQGGLLISDGDDKWKMARKIITPAFHFKILEKFVDQFEESSAVFIDILGREVGKDSVDVHDLVSNLALDVICQTAMGIQLNIQSGSHDEYRKAVSGMCKIVVERAFNPLKTENWSYYFSKDYQNEKQYVKILHEVSDGVIEKRRREIENEANNDIRKGKMAFLDLLLRYRDANGEPLSHDFIRHEVDTFMFAGHDTTAAAISFALYSLANNPEIQEKALNEIREVVDDGTQITYRDLQELKYLELVIKETLRLYPSVPMYSRRTTQDVVYEDGKIIPKGITLLILAYAINRNPEVYENPDQFIPTRFLDGHIKPFAYLPFSAGPRNCIGQKFAMLEMKSILAKVLLNFELLPAIPNVDLILAAETVLISKNGVNIRLKKRLETDL